MKRTLFLLFTLIIMLLLVVVASAQDSEQWSEVSYQDSENAPTSFQAYIEEQILPIIVGVVTSIIALLGSLKSLLSGLKNLNAAKNEFKETAAQMSERAECDSKALSIAYNAIKDSVKSVPELIELIKAQDKKIESLEETMVIAAEILSLAYSANSELVSTGKAKEMNRLLSKLAPTGARKEVAEDEIV